MQHKLYFLHIEVMASIWESPSIFEIPGNNLAKILLYKLQHFDMYTFYRFENKSAIFCLQCIQRDTKTIIDDRNAQVSFLLL